MSYVHVTTNAQAQRAAEMSASRKEALRQADKATAERNGDTVQARALDGLGLLYRDGDLTDDQLRVGRKYQEAWSSIQGLRGRNSLDMSPPGDKDVAMQILVDAGRLVDAFEAHCTTKGELAALRSVVGRGDSVRAFSGGGRAHREVKDRLLGLLERMVKSGL
jgi:hypothetical protein